MPDFLLGLDAVIYRNTIVSWVSPVWLPINIVRDVTLGGESGSFDASTRGTGRWRQTAKTLRDASVDINILYRPGDPGYEALRNAWLKAGGYIDLVILSDDIGTAGAEGLRAEFDVFTFSRGEPLEEGQTIDINVKPRPSVNNPQWVVSDGSSLIVVDP